MQHDDKTMSLSVMAISLLAIALLVGCATNRAPSRQIDDAAITTRVESRLAANPNTNNFEIDVDTLDGVVRLGGTVETAEQREEAERTAASTSGVRDVDNDLQLGDPTFVENVDDAVITAKIKAKLIADPQINPLNVDVDSVRGVVTLSGKVASEIAREEAARHARGTAGVHSVNNLLAVVDG